MGTSLRTRWKRLTTAWFGFRNRGSVVIDGDRTPDPTILALVDAPIETVEEAVERFDVLERVLRERNDRRAVFLTVYARVTRAVADRIEAGRFNDPDWVARYLVTFANYYRRAICGYEQGHVDALPLPWQIALAAAEYGDTLYIQDAVLGINAHINYDLAYALDDVATRPDRGSKYDDHCAIMDVLARLVDETQDQLAAEFATGIADIDETFGSLDEWLWVFTIDEARDNAWDRAVALDSRFRSRRWAARWFNHLTSTGAAYLILSPTMSARSTAFLHDIEEGEGIR